VGRKSSRFVERAPWDGRSRQTSRRAIQRVGLTTGSVAKDDPPVGTKKRGWLIRFRPRLVAIGGWCWGPGGGDVLRGDGPSIAFDCSPVSPGWAAPATAPSSPRQHCSATGRDQIGRARRCSARAWVVWSGHSRGGIVISRVARAGPEQGFRSPPSISLLPAFGRLADEPENGFFFKRTDAGGRPASLIPGQPDRIFETASVVDPAARKALRRELFSGDWARRRRSRNAQGALSKTPSRCCQNPTRPLRSGAERFGAASPSARLYIDSGRRADPPCRRALAGPRKRM